MSALSHPQKQGRRVYSPLFSPSFVPDSSALTRFRSAMNHGRYVLIAYAKRPCANTAKLLEVRRQARQGGTRLVVSRRPR